MKEIKGYPNYLISRQGLVYSKHKKGYLTPNKNHKGYLLAALFNKDGRRYKSIHRIVAEAYIDNPENKSTVNHIDGDKLNNRVENLEWMTNSENIEHGQGKAVDLIDPSGDLKQFKSIASAAREIGANNSAVWQLIEGMVSHCKGWRVDKRQLGLKFNMEASRGERKLDFINPNGEKITIYGVAKASKKMGICETSIREMLRGDKKSVKGWSLCQK